MSGTSGITRSRGHRELRLARTGFTLLEMMVAVAISGIVFLGAGLLFAIIGDSARAIENAAASSHREANGDRVLRSLVGQLESGLEAGGFGGDDRSVRFTTWCTVPSGWQERCRAVLSIEIQGTEPILVANLSTGEVITLRSGFVDGGFRYIPDAHRGGTWLRIWGTGITTPLALAVLLDADTLIIPIGERG